MKDLFQEIHERSLWQILGGYLGVAWLVLQVVDVLGNNFGLPEWLAPASLMLLAIGLPLVLLTAFVNKGLGARSAADPASPEAGRRRRWTWLSWRRVLLGGTAAFGLLGLVTAGYLAARSLGIGPPGTLMARGVMEARSALLVADFGGSDRELARTVTEALRIDLSQSRVVDLVELTEIGDALRRMERAPDVQLDFDLAKEVARREGIPVVVAGEVSRAGEARVLSARLVEVETGDVLVSTRQTAEDGSGVVGAIDALSRTLRERIGESLRDLNRQPPLERVTTGSLPALERYSAGVRAADLSGEISRGVELLEEAVALDSSFAMAWRKLATTLNNQFLDRARAVEALDRAHALAERLPPRERYEVEGIYQYEIEKDIPAALRAYQNLLDLDPTRMSALNAVGVLQMHMGDYARSQEHLSRAIAEDSTSTHSWRNLVQARFASGDTVGASEALDAFQSAHPGHPVVVASRAILSAAVGDFEQSERIARELLERSGPNPAVAGQAGALLAAALATRGRFEEARGVIARGMEGAAAAGVADVFLTAAATAAEFDLVARGSGAAGETLADAYARFRLDSVPPLNRPYGPHVSLLARAGRVGDAAVLWREAETVLDPRAISQRQEDDLAGAAVHLAIAQGRIDEALDLAREADRGFCTACGPLLLAQVHDAAGRSEEAIAEYRRYIDTPWFFRTLAFDQYVRGPTLERLGQLYERQGDLSNARRYYGEFVALWENADPSLQPRVDAARTRLRRILDQTG